MILKYRIGINLEYNLYNINYINLEFLETIYKASDEKKTYFVL